VECRSAAEDLEIFDEAGIAKVSNCLVKQSTRQKMKSSGSERGVRHEASLDRDAAIASNVLPTHHVPFTVTDLNGLHRGRRQIGQSQPSDPQPATRRGSRGMKNALPGEVIAPLEATKEQATQVMKPSSLEVVGEHRGKNDPSEMTMLKIVHLEAAGRSVSRGRSKMKASGIHVRSVLKKISPSTSRTKSLRIATFLGR
jgi:hypothetical protein